MVSELDKWSKVHERARAIQEFLDFLNEKGISLCTLENDDEYPDTPRYFPNLIGREDLIYECYGIDPVQLEQERRSLLKQAVEKSGS